MSHVRSTGIATATATAMIATATAIATAMIATPDEEARMKANSYSLLTQYAAVLT